MSNDRYAKTQEKVSDLNRRLERLETISADDPPEKTLVFSGAYLFAKQRHAERTSYFSASAARRVNCTARISLPSGITAEARFYSGGELVAERYFTLSEAQAEFSFDAVKGVNDLKTDLSLLGYTVEPEEPYAVSLRLEVSGIVDNRLISEHLRVIDDGLIGVKSDDTFTVLKIENGELKGVGTLFGAVEADATKYGNGYVAAIRTAEKACYLVYFDADFEETRRVSLGSGYKKMSLRVLGTPVVYAIKGNVLCEITFSGDVPSERTIGVKGRDVKYFNAYDAEYLAVTDLLGNVLCFRMRKSAPTNVRRTFALGVKENLFIPYDGEFTIMYSENGKVWSVLVSDACVYGEKTYVCDGKQAVVAGNVVVAFNESGGVEIIA